jgi:hypothetical protein
MVTFDPDGHVSDVVHDAGPFAGTPVGDCIIEKFRAANMPPFDGGRVRAGRAVEVR